MSWVISSSGSTYTSALGYRPAPLHERVTAVLGDLRFQSAVCPLYTAACLMTVTLTRPVPALQRSATHRQWCTLEPESNEDRRDYTLERGVNLITSYATARRLLNPFSPRNFLSLLLTNSLAFYRGV